MPFTPDEAVTLGAELIELGQFLNKALRKDDAGKVKLDPSESKELLRRLTALTAKVALDALD
jgi:sialic acid synthase SpsE